MADQPDPAKIEQLKSSISEAQTAALNDRVDLQLRIAQILTPEQRQKARELPAGRAAGGSDEKGGPGPGGARGPVRGRPVRCQGRPQGAQRGRHMRRRGCQCRAGDHGTLAPQHRRRTLAPGHWCRALGTLSTWHPETLAPCPPWPYDSPMRTTGKGLVTVLVGLVLALGVAAPAVAKSTGRNRFDARIRLLPGGDLEVVETVVFRFETGTFDHVFREIPSRHTDGIEIVSASMDGRAFPHRRGCQSPRGETGIANARPVAFPAGCRVRAHLRAQLHRPRSRPAGRHGRSAGVARAAHGASIQDRFVHGGVRAAGGGDRGGEPSRAQDGVAPHRRRGGLRPASGRAGRSGAGRAPRHGAGHPVERLDRSGDRPAEEQRPHFAPGMAAHRNRGARVRAAARDCCGTDRRHRARHPVRDAPAVRSAATRRADGVARHHASGLAVAGTRRRAARQRHDRAGARDGVAVFARGRRRDLHRRAGPRRGSASTIS